MATGGGRDGAGASALGAGAGADAAGAAGCAGAPPVPSSTRIGEPCATLSPTLSRISFTFPAAGEGTSIVALSLSSVTSDCSTATVSPGFTRISITSTLLKSPMSGMSTRRAPAAAGAGALAAGAGAGAAGAFAGAADARRRGAGAAATADFAASPEAADFAASAPPSSVRIGLPSETLSPILTRTSFTTPAEGDGISIVALSLSSVTSDCSTATVSPGFTRISITSTLLKSPMSGTMTSCMAPMVVAEEAGAVCTRSSPFPL